MPGVICGIWGFTRDGGRDEGTEEGSLVEILRLFTSFVGVGIPEPLSTTPRLPEDVTIGAGRASGLGSEKNQYYKLSKC